MTEDTDADAADDTTPSDDPSDGSADSTPDESDEPTSGESEESPPRESETPPPNGGGSPNRVSAGSHGPDDEDVEELREELDDLRDRVESRTVDRDEFEDELESDLKLYVRRQIGRGHVRGWGPYLVLLYGTVMTLGAFYYLAGWVAIAAMFVIWLSTLGLFAVMLLTGAGLGIAGRLKGVVGAVRRIRS